MRRSTITAHTSSRDEQIVTQIIRFPYSASAYITRRVKLKDNKDTHDKTAEAIVAEQAAHLSKGTVDVKPLMAFQAVKGAGKTWLALHVKRDELVSKGFASHLLMLATDTGRDCDGHDQTERCVDTTAFTDEAMRQAAVEATLRWLIECTQTAPLGDATPQELTGQLQQAVIKRYSDKVFILIVDSLFEAEANFRTLLAHHILAPLASLPHVLIVMTGRGDIPFWVSERMRTQVDIYELQPLTEAQTEQQIEMQASHAKQQAEEIYDMSQGYPWATYLIAQNPGDPVESLRPVIDALFESVPAHDRERMKNTCMALSLEENGFRVRDIPILLNRWYDIPSNTQQGRADTTKDDLLKYGLIRWDAGWFVLDDNLQHLLPQYLLAEADHDAGVREKLQRAHSDLYRKYDERAQLHQDSKADLLAQREIHAAKLKELGTDPAEQLHVDMAEIEQ